MGFFNFFKKKDNSIKDTQTAEELFKDAEIIIKNKKICDECTFKKLCREKERDASYYCDWVVDINFDRNKKSILLIDDNEGMISFLKDDIEYLNDQELLDLNNLNLITMSGAHAAFNLEATQIKAGGLNISYAIIDITLGGTQITDRGTIKYTGVDVFEMIHNYNPDVKFIFYTGNNLNPHIQSNARLINQFKSIYGKNIKDFILFKTSMDIDDRREFISKKLFLSDK